MKSKKYALVYHITGKAGKEHQKLVKELANKFNNNYLIENPLPSHATLKYPFRTNKIKDIENLLRGFVKNKKSAEIKIRKIGRFGKHVVYMKVEFSKPALIIFWDLIKELDKISWVRWTKFDKQAKFHATLIYGRRSFNKIWQFVSKKKFNFTLKFDNIIILKKTNKWKIYKNYRF